MKTINYVATKNSTVPFDFNNFFFQIAAMRAMNFGTDDSEKMVNNYRPPCPLGDRNIRKM